ncbi:MAG: hypothetical protein IJZ29_05210 [Clostridia bacterium]|nr:hypothetical protein [Clostridia bacterium]
MVSCDNFKESTNFTFSYGIVDILIHDCFYFGFVKNNTANISGFLNYIIPRLSKYRENLHNNFLANNNDNEELVKVIEDNLYNIYLNNFNLDDDKAFVIPFRINKSNKDEFVYIHDVLLDKFNMNFTHYVRTLLIEYSVKPLFQREYFYFYYDLSKINEAMANGNILKIYLEENVIEVMPMAIEVRKKDNINYICGCDKDKSGAYVIKMSAIKQISLLDKFVELNNNEYENISELIIEMLEGDEV